MRPRRKTSSPTCSLRTRSAVRHNTWRRALSVSLSQHRMAGRSSCKVMTSVPFMPRARGRGYRTERFGRMIGRSDILAGIVTRTPDLILASASPRRRELLESVGLALAVEPVDLDEAARQGEPVRDYATRVAREKCDTAVLRLGTPALAVLAADTIVSLAGEIRGKPVGEEGAAAMLRRLAGHRHEVLTAYRIRHGERMVERTVGTFV